LTLVHNLNAARAYVAGSSSFCSPMPRNPRRTRSASSRSPRLDPLDASGLNRDIAILSRSRLAEHITGGLSLKPKMPCPSWGIPATRCLLGSLLAPTRKPYWGVPEKDITMKEPIDRKALEAQLGKVWDAEELEQAVSPPSSSRTSLSGAGPITWLAPWSSPASLCCISTFK
jgi:hypothetical protein